MILNGNNLLKYVYFSLKIIKNYRILIIILLVYCFLWYKYTTIKFYNEELIFIHNENNILFYNMKYMDLHEINKASLEKIDSIYFVNCFDYLSEYIILAALTAAGVSPRICAICWYSASICRL